MTRSDLIPIAGLLLVSIVFAFAGGANMPDDNADRLLVTLSVQDATINSIVTAEVRDEKGMLVQQEATIAYGSSSAVSFIFNGVQRPDSLQLHFGTNEFVQINGMSIRGGDAYRSWNGEELWGEMKMVRGNADLQSDGRLKLRSDGAGIALMLNGSIEFAATKYHMVIVVLLFVMFFGLGLLIYFRASKKSLIPILVSTLFACLSAYLLLELKDRIASAKMDVRFETAVAQEQLVEVYYSPDGLFRPDKLIARESAAHTAHDMRFQLPSGIHRTFRLDLPAGRKLHLQEIKLALKPFSISMDDIEHNDLTLYPANMSIATGLDDPYLILSGKELVDRFTRYQELKWGYPYRLAGILFLVFLLIFTRGGSMHARVFALLFSISITLPALTWVFREDAIILHREKKLAAQKPTEWKGAKGTARDLNAYVSDQFGGRATMITRWNTLKVRLMQQTGSTAPVLIGKEGWMFYRAEGVKELSENKTPFTESELALMCQTLEDRTRWMSLYGVDYYVTFPLLKHRVYEDKLPRRVKKRNARSRLEQLEEALQAYPLVNVISLDSVLRGARDSEDRPVYYKRDTHWNLLGAYHGYRKIISEIAKDHPEVGNVLRKDQYVWHDTLSTDGDLTYLLSQNELLPRTEIIPVPINGYKAQFATSAEYPSHESPHAVQTRVVADTSLPRMIMNRDSYANFLIPFLSEHFSQSIYLWTPVFDAQVVKDEHPDVVITEMMERFVDDLQLPVPELITKELATADSLEALMFDAEVMRTQR